MIIFIYLLCTILIWTSARIPREEIKKADKLSKQVGYDDWFITKDLKMLTNKWGKVSINRFASHTNKKTQKFTFSADWSNEKGFHVPPVYLGLKTIKHFMSSKYSAKAILVRPYWPTLTFWPPFFKAEGEFQIFIKGVFVTEDATST